MGTNLKDAMATAVIQEVLSKPHEYPRATCDMGFRPFGSDPYTEFLTNDNAIAKAKAENLEIVYPAENELQIDIDNEQAYLFYKEQISLIERFVVVAARNERPSKSGLPRRHITLRLGNSVTPIERLCLQACLGSDRVREILGYIRYKIPAAYVPWWKRAWNRVTRKKKDSSPTLFFEKKES